MAKWIVTYVVERTVLETRQCVVNASEDRIEEKVQELIDAIASEARKPIGKIIETESEIVNCEVEDVEEE